MLVSRIWSTDTSMMVRVMAQRRAFPYTGSFVACSGDAMAGESGL